MGTMITFLRIFLGWLGAILLLGNIAVATYCLIRLFRAPTLANLREVQRKRTA